MTKSRPAGWYKDPDGGVGQRYWDGQRWTARYGVVRRRRMGPLPRVGAAAGTGMAVLALAGVVTASLAGYAAQNPGLLVTSSPAAVTSSATSGASATTASSAPAPTSTSVTASSTASPEPTAPTARNTSSATHPTSATTEAPSAAGQPTGKGSGKAARKGGQSTYPTSGSNARGRGWLHGEASRGKPQPLWSLPSPACVVQGVLTRRGEHLYYLPGQRGYRPPTSNRPGVRLFCSEREALRAGYRQG